jgi:hypothetical protein
LFLDFAACVGWHAVGKVRFLKLRAVDINSAVLEENGIAPDADDAFDGKAFGGGIAYDNYVLARGGTKMVDPTVEEVMVRIVKSREHAGTDYFDGLDEVGADDIVAGQAKAGDDEALKELPKETFAAFGFGCRIVCEGICRKRLRIGRLHVHVHHVKQDDLFSGMQQGAKLPSEDGYFTEEDIRSKHQNPKLQGNIKFQGTLD